VSVEENKAKQRRLVEEVVNKGNLAMLPEFIAPNYVFHELGMEFRGPEGLKQYFAMLRNAFPDLHYAIDNMVAEGDTLVVFFTLTGTLKGELMGAAPTGKRMTLPAVLLVRWEGGKEVEAWAYSDSLSMYRQLGIPIPSA
jgi:predicted ester cyclase